MSWHYLVIRTVSTRIISDQAAQANYAIFICLLLLKKELPVCTSYRVYLRGLNKYFRGNGKNVKSWGQVLIILVVELNAGRMRSLFSI